RFPRRPAVTQPTPNFWGLPVDQLCERLETSERGLSSDMAQQRLSQQAAACLKPRRRTRLSILLAQFNSLIILLLFCSAGLSFLLGDRTNAAIILFILIASSLLGYWQEQGADDAVARLLHATVDQFRTGWF